MKISHKIKNVTGEDIIYIYVTVNDIYEFGKENLGKGENSNFLKSLREYISNNLKETKKAAAVIVINGVVIGTLTLAALIPDVNAKNNNNTKNVQVYIENENLKYEEKENIKLEENKDKQSVNDKTDEIKEQITTGKKEKVNITTNSNAKSTTNKSTSSSKKTTTTNKVTNTSTKSSAKTSSNNTTTKNTTTKANTNTNTTSSTSNNTSSNNTNTTTSQSNTNNSNTNTKTSSGITIKFNNGGIISNIDLEEYVIGVVAAEMPASFNIEALKAQAITARTYAMKKHSKGITLVNSTAHQVYYSEAQMKSLWGSSYNTYYNKIKSAVTLTKGQVLKYGGEYIEAQFYAISNGKSELPKYVWNYSYPYLQAVSSSWDEGISAGKYSINMTYEKMSEKLGIKVDKDSEIKIISKTAGDRVDKISIAGKTFTGVNVRTKLGLRSADFIIKQNESNVTISTVGFGHGVGMSQYGANGAAKAGMTYRQILSHYYPGTSLVNI